MYNLRAYVLLLKLLFECSLELQAIFIKHFFLFSVCLQDSTIGTHSKVSNKHNVDHFTMSSPHNTTHSQHNLLFKVFKRPFIMEGNSEGTALLCGLVLPFLSLNWKFGSLDQWPYQLLPLIQNFLCRDFCRTGVALFIELGQMLIQILKALFMYFQAPKVIKWSTMLHTFTI